MSVTFPERDAANPSQASEPDTVATHRNGRLSPVATGGLAASLFFLAIAAMLPHRHFFDDETINATLIRTKSLAQLYKFAQSQDVHPPLHYLANGLVYQLTGSLQAILWLNALGLGATLFWFVRRIAGQAKSDLARVALAVAVGLNPSLLLWGVSLRWYSYWVPLALWLFTLLFLTPRKRSTLPLAVGLGVISFYFGYLTLVYGLALAAVEWVTKGIQVTRRKALAALIGAAAIAPQCFYLLTVHIPQGKGQTTHNWVKLLGSAGIGTFVGPLIFPVHPLAIAFSMGVLGVSGIIGANLVKRQAGRPWKDGIAALDPAFLVAVALLGLEIGTGIAIKERNLVIANVLLFAWIPLHLDLLPRWTRVGLAALAALFFTVSVRNGILSRDTGKASVNMPVASLRREIADDEARFHTDDRQTWLVSWNDVDSCYGLLWNMQVASPFDQGVEHEEQPRSYRIPKGALVVLLQTQPGLWAGPNWPMAQKLVRQVEGSLAQTRSINLGYDRYHSFESKMTSAPFPTYPIHYVSGIAKTDIEIQWRTVHSETP